jgi:hypothetical protein
MRRMNFLSICALSLLLTNGLIPVGDSRAEDGSGSASATESEGPGEFAQSAIYAGFDGVGAFSDDSAGDHTGGVGVRLGWRFHPNLSVEGNYQYYHDLYLNDGWSVTGNLKAHLLTGRWQPTLFAGLGYLDSNTFGGDMLVRVGAGLDVYITENWSIGPELAYLVMPESSGSPDEGFITLSFGVTWRATEQ